MVLEKRKGRTDEMKQTQAKFSRISLVKSPYRPNKETSEKSPRTTLDNAPAKQKTDEMKKSEAMESRKRVKNAVAKPSDDPRKNIRNTRKDATESLEKEKDTSNVDGSPKFKRSVTRTTASSTRTEKEKPGLETTRKTRGVTRSASGVERSTRMGKSSSDEAVSPVIKKKNIGKYCKMLDMTS